MGKLQCLSERKEVAFGSTVGRFQKNRVQEIGVIWTENFIVQGNTQIMSPHKGDTEFSKNNI